LTTAEIISSSDTLIMIIKITNFLKTQGYPVHDTILFQDNMRTMIRSEKNGRQTSSKTNKQQENQALDYHAFFYQG
jgi:hypothetical protein